MSFQNDFRTYEEAKTKNMFDSLIDILKPSIKIKENKKVITILNIVKDKPETYLELLSVAIFHKNFEIIKLIKEKYINTEIDAPYMNASSFFNSILPEESKSKLNDQQDNYIDIMCPFALMAGIGGDIGIFKYLLNNHLIPDLNVSGTIGLSKKFKNVFTSNIIGACSYYGNDELLEYLLKNYRSDLDINIISTEKKSKNTKFHFSREFSGMTPPLLVCASPISDQQTIKILKILEDYKANLEMKDSNEDNIIHITIKSKKIQTLKFLINSLDLKDIMNDTNNDNMTPYAIAQKMKCEEIITFLNGYGKLDEKQIEENLKELIEDSNHRANKANKNKKKGKKNKNDFPFLLNSSEYQETLKVNENDEEEKEKKNNDDEKEEKIENNEENEAKDEDNEDDYNNNEEQESYTKNNKINKNDNNKNYNNKNGYNNKKNYYNKYDYNNNYKNIQNFNYNNYTNNYNNNYNTNYNNYNNHNYNNKIYDNNYKTNNYYNNNYYKCKGNGLNIITNQRGYYNNSNNSGYYTRNQNDKRRYYDNNTNQSNRSGINELENYNNNKMTREEQETQENKENKQIQETKEKEIKDNLNNNEQNEENEKNKNNIDDDDDEDDIEINFRNNYNDNNKKNNQSNNNSNNNNNNKNEKVEEGHYEEEGSYSDEDFLKSSDKEEDNYKNESEKEKEKENNLKKISEYNELYKNYIDIERKCINLEREKNELKKYIKKIYMNKKINTGNIPSDEEKINSLLNIANEEIEKKDKLIIDLKNKTIMADLSDIQNFSQEKLNEYKTFYLNNLKIINDAIEESNK